MKLQLDFNPEVSVKKIKIGDRITLLGSCFSDEIALKLKESGFHVSSNPFGTIFHPTALANLILIENFESSILKRDDLYFSWFSAGTIYDLEKSKLIEKLALIQNELINSIQNSNFLFVTFGTSFAYENESYGSVVANCHKQPPVNFKKVLSTVGEMRHDWEMCMSKIYELNPDIEIVFTVSPVRHIKDGIIENNRSKARLIELTNQLSELTDAKYFPSYELVIDVLRDYRFYKEDLIHPDNQAVEFVYSHFENIFFDDLTKEITKEIRKIRVLNTHKIRYPESVKSIEFEQNTAQKIKEFSIQYPSINW